jgi:3-hydroxyisobutyrate dehydrogenase/2-hydroxy-3-oxopropionate reductase
MILGGMMATFCEGVALGEKGGLGDRQILEVLDAGALANPMFKGKGAMLLQGEFPTSFPLKHMQKDLRLAVALGDELGQPLHTAATANETFKRACAAGHADEDVAAVYRVIR